MERKPLIVSGIAAVVIVLALVAFLMTRGDDAGSVAPVAEVTTAATDPASPSATASTSTPPATSAPVPTTAKPSTAVTTAPPAAAPAPTKPSSAKVFARPPATVESRANNTYTFYVEQLTPLDSVVDVHLNANGAELILHCPTPVSPGNCQVTWTTGSHQVVMKYHVTVDPVDPRYKTYSSTPLQFTTG